MASFFKNVVLEFVVVVVYVKEVHLFLQTFLLNSPMISLDEFLPGLSIEPK